MHSASHMEEQLSAALIHRCHFQGPTDQLQQQQNQLSQ